MKNIIIILFLFINSIGFGQVCSINQGGTQTNIGGYQVNQTVSWDDLLFPFSLGNSGGNTYPAFVPDSGYYSFVLDTTGVSKCIQYMTVQMPHDWKEGTYIEPHIHYKKEGTTTPVFKVKYYWVDIDELLVPITYSWLVLSVSSSITHNNHAVLYDGLGINGAGHTISSVLYCQVYCTTLSTGTTVAKGLSFDIHYQRDGLGSRNSLPPK